MLLAWEIIISRIKPLRQGCFERGFALHYTYINQQQIKCEFFLHKLSAAQHILYIISTQKREYFFFVLDMERAGYARVAK
jgi:hypothetical protein